MLIFQIVSTIKKTAVLALKTHRKQLALTEALAGTINVLVTVVADSNMSEDDKIESLTSIGNIATDLADAFRRHDA